ncbi:MAG: hypothetical protein KC776_38820 [Myxococcales bacterium]|nr:hypothetical protein [Myxococcales bacterium]MCB9583133.1 hypothetical protein [Polyangiaceae bacterium]
MSSRLLAAAVLLWAGVAHSESAVQGTADVAVGYTDNVRSSPKEPPPGISGKAGDSFLLLSPGVGYAQSSAGALQRVGYTLSFTLFAHQDEANSVSQRADYRGLFDLSPNASLVLGAAASQARPYSSTTLTSAGLTELGAWAPGSSSIVVVTADELLSIDLSPELRGYQSGHAGFGAPLFGGDGPRTFEGGGLLGAERLFRADAIGAEAASSYAVATRTLRSDGTAAGTQRQLMGTGAGIWRHDFGTDFASRLELGAGRVQRLESGRGFWYPTGSALLGFARDEANAEVSYAHRVTTNLSLGQFSIVDQVQARGGVPIGAFALEASAGAERGRLIEEDATRAARVDLWQADVQLAWQALPGVSVALRYQHIEQRSDASAPPLPLSFVKNTILLLAGVRVPPDDQLPRRPRSPRRVDRSDALSPQTPGARAAP